MKKHPEYGANILAGSIAPTIRIASEIALSHHERYDGTGYPLGLKADEIPISGRIVAVADVFDALTMDRSYRKAMSDQDALLIMKQRRGTHFDPEVYNAFMSITSNIIATRQRLNQSEPTGIVH
jgi:putative two-component system response regulator